MQIGQEVHYVKEGWKTDKTLTNTLGLLESILPPPPPCDHANTVPDFTSIAIPADNKEWKDGPKIIRSLKKAYSLTASHSMLIPSADRDEMMSFLNRGPTNPDPAQWFKIPCSTTAAPTTTPTHTSDPTTVVSTTGGTTIEHVDEPPLFGVFGEVFESQPVTLSEHNREYQPIGVARARSASIVSSRAATGKTCRCGSFHHLRTNHRRCPLNPRNRRPIIPQDNQPVRRRRRVLLSTQPPMTSSTDTESTPPTENTSTDTTDTDTDTETDDEIPLELLLQRRKVRVGRKIAKEFDDTIYLGHISGLPKSGGKYYEIVYDDGDSETMKEIHVLKSILLYQKHRKNK